MWINVHAASAVINGSVSIIWPQKRHTKTKLHKDNNVMKYCTYLIDIETKSIETPKPFHLKQLLANEKYSASVSL